MCYIGCFFQIPLFLLFLDCVWQLTQQYPSGFAFSETYLVTLWDSVHMGVFETFLFDCCHQRSRYHIDARWQQRLFLPSAWEWNVQFSDDDQSFFNNPLYVMKTNPDVNEALNKAKYLQSSLRSKISSQELYSYELQNLEGSNVCIDGTKSVKGHRLTPLTGAACMKLWTQCYLRWQTPAQIIGGGNPSQYLQQCVMVEEILCLLHKIEALKKNNAKSANSLARTRSDLVFSMALDTPRTTELLANTYLSSSFPFSSVQRLSREEKSVFTPISLFLEHSTIDYDYSNDDDWYPWYLFWYIDIFFLCFFFRLNIPCYSLSVPPWTKLFLNLDCLFLYIVKHFCCYLLIYYCSIEKVEAFILARR